MSSVAIDDTQEVRSASSVGIGTVLDERFRLEAVLGEGGFGVVYRATQISTGQTVAIKLLQPEKLLNASRAGVEHARFEREMQLIARLKHPNIVRLIDSGTTLDGQLYTVLEYIDGEPLSALIDREGPMAPRDATRLMQHVMEALSCAHAQGIVHRDLKPQNIMVNTSGARASALVLDFGISAVISTSRDGDYRSLTATGQFQGTPSYMAPEQLRERELTPATDLYAWGLVFLECLVGRPVIVEPSFAAIIYRQMSPEPVPVPAAVAHHEVGAIVTRAVAKSLDERYASADEVLSDLDAIDASQPLPMALHTTAETPDLPQALATTAGPGGVTTGGTGLDALGDTADVARLDTGEDDAIAAPTRSRGLVAAVAVLSVLLLGALAWIGLSSVGSEAPSKQDELQQGDDEPAQQVGGKDLPAKDGAAPPTGVEATTTNILTPAELEALEAEQGAEGDAEARDEALEVQAESPVEQTEVQAESPVEQTGAANADPVQAQRANDPADDAALEQALQDAEPAPLAKEAAPDERRSGKVDLAIGSESEGTTVQKMQAKQVKKKKK